MINDYITEYFDVLCGVKQGDNLSPTLFNLLVTYPVKLMSFIVVLDLVLNRLAYYYADDIVILSDSEKGLQSMLT